MPDDGAQHGAAGETAERGGAPLLRTTAGDFPLQEYRLRLAGREWSVEHVGAVISYADESHLFAELFKTLPYGVALWPAAIALAHDVASRAGALGGARVLELGSGTGLPGVVAATLGARVVQTDRNPLAMSVCKRNGGRNGAAGIEYRLADWTAWGDTGRYEWIFGSDVLYADEMHPHLRRIFETNLAPGGGCCSRTRSAGRASGCSRPWRRTGGRSR